MRCSEHSRSHCCRSLRPDKAVQAHGAAVVSAEHRALAEQLGVQYVLYVPSLLRARGYVVIAGGPDLIHPVLQPVEGGSLEHIRVYYHLRFGPKKGIA